MAVNPPIPEPSARSQVLAMHYAVRWEIGIGHPEFLDGSLEGERWLVWAAGNVRPCLHLAIVTRLRINRPKNLHLRYF